MPRKSSAMRPRCSISSARSFSVVLVKWRTQKPIERLELPLIITASRPARKHFFGLHPESADKLYGLPELLRFRQLAPVRQSQELSEVSGLMPGFGLQLLQ